MDPQWHEEDDRQHNEKRKPKIDVLSNFLEERKRNVHRVFTLMKTISESQGMAYNSPMVWEMVYAQVRGRGTPFLDPFTKLIVNAFRSAARMHYGEANLALRDFLVAYCYGNANAKLTVWSIEPVVATMSITCTPQDMAYAMAMAKA